MFTFWTISDIFRKLSKNDYTKEVPSVCVSHNIKYYSNYTYQMHVLVKTIKFLYATDPQFSEIFDIRP